MSEREKRPSDWYRFIKVINLGLLYGGSDKQDWDEYTKNDGVPYYDKGGHLERSKYHQPNHKKHK